MAKRIWISFYRYLSGVFEDYMLVACMFAPIFMGLFFQFGLTALESALCHHFEKAALISPYYELFDLLLAVMTPVMFAFSGVMTVLEELDNGTTRYLVVTPLGKSGYLISRIGLQSFLSIAYSIIVISVFGISNMSFGITVVVSVLCALCGLITSMLVISFAKNRVEGMALIKLSGILIAGIPVVYFVSSKLSYVCGILPSFWIAKIARERAILYVIPAFISIILWIGALYRKFYRKLL